MVVTWSKKSCLGVAKLVSFVFLVLSKDGGRRVSSIFHLFFLMLIKGMGRRCEFKIFLCDPRDGNILLRSSASC